MKQLFIAILIALLGFPMLAQEVQFPSAIISAGGGSLEDNTISFSRYARWVFILTGNAKIWQEQAVCMGYHVIYRYYFFGNI